MVASCLFACQKQVTSDLDPAADANARIASTETLTSTCGLLRTQTQGGWGSTPNGNNPGAYLHANFNATFPEGLTVGCYPGNYYLKLTSAQAVTDLLPSGGKASALSANFTDPASLNNVLVGQVVALKLSVSFDAANASFGESSVALGKMIIGSGKFKGKTVSQFLVIAERVLGGCSHSYTVQQVNETASLINQNFVDGTSDGGFLVCPGNGGGSGGGSNNPA
jgi:hypothetical protein